MPAIQHIKHIDDATAIPKNLIEAINQDIDKLNWLITDYNASVNREASISKLKDILRSIQLIENTYSDKYISKCPDFAANVQVKLFSEIQAEFIKYGISNLYGILTPDNPPPINTFSTILANMPPEQVKRLISILSHGSRFNLEELKEIYAPIDNPEFNQFLSNNSIQFLGGNNSRNFKISPLDGSSPYILKIENRMGMPRLPALYLQDKSLKKMLLPIMAHRQASIKIAEKVITQTILTTQFCAGGDLICDSERHGEDYQERMKSALHIYEQMLNCLIDISKDGCAFPDMKNTNWLVDTNGKLLLNDTKSLVFCEANGMIDYTNITRTTSDSFIFSPNISPPEFYDKLAQKIPISAEKMHAYIFGKNLYQYLTQRQTYDFKDEDEGEKLNFNYPIFETREGQVLKSLICGLVREDPNNRISLKEAQNKLYPIMAGQHKKDIIDLLDQIKDQGLGSVDTKMNIFVAEKMALIKQTNAPPQLDIIKADLENILHNQAVVKEARAIIQKFEDRAGLFTIGMRSKANRIKQAICDIPIEDRGKITDQNFEPGLKVRLQIASHRHFTHFHSVKIANNVIDKKTAAKSYKEFEEKLKKITHPDDGINPNVKKNK